MAVYQLDKYWLNTDTGKRYNDQASALAASKSSAASPTSNSAPPQTPNKAAGAPQQLQTWLGQLKDAQAQVVDGKMKLTDYQSLVSNIIPQAANLTGSVAGQGQSAANSVNPIWQQFQNAGFTQPNAGKWEPLSGFNTQQMAQLPDSVLPTQDEVDRGLYNPSFGPQVRTQTPANTPGSNPSQPAGPPTVAPPPTQGTKSPDATGQPLPQVNTTLPATINTTTDQGKAALQGQQNAKQLQDVLNKQYGVNTQAVQQFASGISGIPDIYKQEGQSQQNQLNALADQQKTSRAQSLQDLATTLAGNQQNLFNRAIPGLAEQANTSGIYRSTGFGDILANKYANLTADTQNQLALQGLSDRESYLGAQQNALNTGLGYSGQAAQVGAQGQQTIAGASSGALQGYGAGMGDVANAQIGMQNAGLQRQFSLQDYATQYANALNLANSAKTQGPSGKASPGTQAGIQTAIGIGQLGATAYGGYAGKAGSQALASAYNSRNV